MLMFTPPSTAVDYRMQRDDWVNSNEHHKKIYIFCNLQTEPS